MPYDNYTEDLLGLKCIVLIKIEEIENVKHQISNIKHQTSNIFNDVYAFIRIDETQNFRM